MKRLSVIPIFIFCILLTSSVALAADTNAPTKHRIGISLGAHIPTDEYTEDNISLDYKAGGTFGLEYSYMLTENFGIGAFMNYTSFSSESETYSHAFYGNYEVDVDITTTVFGVGVILEHQLNNAIKVYGAGKLGLARTKLEANVSNGFNSGSASDTGSALAAIVEVGAKYPMNKTIDLGLAARYSYINQETAGGDEHSNLGGLALVGLIGFNF